ncbi:hypothetical protein BJ508DRAFT_305627 [Ascobolus immersus RN42]|uniref:Uncharacterized protein n=1 Tax=Ascobolus immersus RN42 TaxID=1160509 RepID=A0A3N4ICT5_ASCIM|nr:hypothetical protein BJ508DRAFT_305627 [Ascobolus immersus RN42]
MSISTYPNPNINSTLAQSTKDRHVVEIRPTKRDDGGSEAGQFEASTTDFQQAKLVLTGYSDIAESSSMLKPSPTPTGAVHASRAISEIPDDHMQRDTSGTGLKDRKKVGICQCTFDFLSSSGRRRRQQPYKYQEERRAQDLRYFNSRRFRKNRTTWTYSTWTSDRCLTLGSCPLPSCNPVPGLGPQGKNRETENVYNNVETPISVLVVEEWLDIACRTR